MMKNLVGGFLLGFLLVSGIFMVINSSLLFNLYTSTKRNTVTPPPLYTIKKTVSTSFAEFNPLTATLPEEGPEILYPWSLSGIKGIELVPENARELLRKNGFVVVKEEGPITFDNIYTENMDNGTPSFVTTDAILDLFHNVYDFTLQYIETFGFYSNLELFVQKMLNWTYQEYLNYNSSQNTVLTDAFERLIAYFEVVSELLGTNNSNQLPQKIMAFVNSEIELVSEREIQFSPILGVQVDYSQMKPRGHYTENELLSRFFQAMMYLIHTPFYLEPEPIQCMLGNITLTRMALIITKGMSPGVTNAYSYWKTFFDPISFLVGKSDDLTYYDYYGYVANITIEELGNNETIRNIILHAKQTLPLPKILGEYVSPKLGAPWENATRAFRVISQAFVPDSYIFQNLVEDKVMGRYLPSGLDVMAVFQSSRALEHLKQTIERYRDYMPQLEELQKTVGSWDETTWTQSVYYLWLYSLLPLLNEKGKEYPTFMRTEAWSDKELITALSAWAEIKHDNLLYAKQSYTALKGIRIGEETYGYVEPNPELYSRLYSVAQMLKDGLEQRVLISSGSDVIRAMNEFTELLNALFEISEKELFQKPLSSEEYQLIREIGSKMSFIKRILKISLNTTTNINTPWLVSDVHTDPHHNHVLEVAVGHVYKIYVIVPDKNGDLQIAVGGVFTYHEFSWDMNDRLTDQQWKEMLENGTAPQMPEWITNYAVTKKE